MDCSHSNQGMLSMFGLRWADHRSHKTLAGRTRYKSSPNIMMNRFRTHPQSPWSKLKGEIPHTQIYTYTYTYIYMHLNCPCILVDRSCEEFFKNQPSPLIPWASRWKSPGRPKEFGAVVDLHLGRFYRHLGPSAPGVPEPPQQRWPMVTSMDSYECCWTTHVHRLGGLVLTPVFWVD